MSRCGCALIESQPNGLGQPFGHFKGSNSVHCFVPYVSDAEIRGQRTTVKTYLLATRYDGST